MLVSNSGTEGKHSGIFLRTGLLVAGDLIGIAEESGMHLQHTKNI